jgi:hypothetical protein
MMLSAKISNYLLRLKPIETDKDKGKYQRRERFVARFNLNQKLAISKWTNY